MNVNFDIEKSLKDCALTVGRELSSCYSAYDESLKTILEAQKYSLLGGGKRIRPYLVLAFCCALGGDEANALPLACAIEMIHTYSLIHDDLPCMDNDDYRRGRLTNHKVYGEAVAVLAGDALLTKAFEIIATASRLSVEARSQAVVVLAQAAGDIGMIGGQVMDMEASQKEPCNLDYLKKMHALKTGALIRAAAVLGCIAAGCSTTCESALAAARYAEKIGLAFQIVDDILDVVGDSVALGKNVGSDKAAGKLTFMNFYSLSEAKAYATRLTDEAIEAIIAYDTHGELRALATYLLQRTH